MVKITMLQFRRDAEAVIRKVRHGKSLVLTYRGKPVMRLEPIQGRVIDRDDPIYKISELARPGGRSPDGRPLRNNEIDEIVY